MKVGGLSYMNTDTVSLILYFDSSYCSYCNLLGDGLCCGEWGEGAYNVTSDDNIIVEGGEFGHNETTLFSVPFVLAPSETPTLSHVPSSSLSPSLSPSLSFSPSEICYWIEIIIQADTYPGETTWIISQQATDDGREEVNVIYDNSGAIDFQVDGRKYSAIHIGNSATNINVTGVLCDCGLGTTQCECQDQFCLIKRGDNFFYEKVFHCEISGGSAAVIYDNGGETPSYSLDPQFAGIPAAFVARPMASTFLSMVLVKKSQWL